MSLPQVPLSRDETLAALPNPRLPLLTRIKYFIQLWLFKVAVSTGLYIQRHFNPSLRAYLPTLIKSYPCRRHLENRVFIPKNHKPGEVLPLYLDVHGGGFALLDPQVDDEFCSVFSNRFNIVIVSIEYTLTPRIKFPVPTHEVADVAQAVIEDPSLPIDKSRVAIGGFSAGGNLALSASQLPELQGKINAIVAWYPVTDWSIPTPEKAKTRPYKNPGDKDTLIGPGKLFNYGYFNAGQNLRDPLLSVSFAKREDLPKWIFFVAAEYDILADEAREMIRRLAGIESLSEEEKYSFERRGYRWRLVRDVVHGFTHNQLERGEKEKKRIEVRDKIFGEVGEWLMKGPFAK